MRKHDSQQKVFNRLPENFDRNPHVLYFTKQQKKSDRSVAPCRHHKSNKQTSENYSYSGKKIVYRVPDNLCTI